MLNNIFVISIYDNYDTIEQIHFVTDWDLCNKTLNLKRHSAFCKINKLNNIEQLKKYFMDVEELSYKVDISISNNVLKYLFHSYKIVFSEK